MHDQYLNVAEHVSSTSDSHLLLPEFTVSIQFWKHIARSNCQNQLLDFLLLASLIDDMETRIAFLLYAGYCNMDELYSIVIFLICCRLVARNSLGSL